MNHTPSGKSAALTPHSRRVLEALQKSAVPLSAYELLGQLQASGIKAPPTVYRALDQLIARGWVHRIETLNAFVACHQHGAEHVARFAVCRSCGTVAELHDQESRLTSSIRALAKTLQFHIEREMLELIGLCKACSERALPSGSGA